MADPAPSSNPGPLVYRPISGLAFAGFILSCLYALLVVVSTLAALIRGGAMYLPGATLLLAFAGAVISFLAMRQIQNSDGTRAGLELARWGLWLSILTGLGYSTFVYATGWALTQQADVFLLEKKDEDSGFFPRVLEAANNPEELNRAFLLTLPPSQRGGSNPGSESDMAKQYDEPIGSRPGKLSYFRNDPLVQILVREGKDKVKVEPQGHDWELQGDGYVVLRNFRISTSEAVVEAVMPVLSVPDPGGQRKWYLAWAPKTTVRLTLLGEAMSYIRGRSYSFLTQEKYVDGKAFPAFRRNNPNKDLTQWDKVTADPKKGAEVQKWFEEFCEGNKPGQWIWPQESGLAGIIPWKLEGGKLRLYHKFEIRPDKGTAPVAAIEGHMVVESVQPEPFDPIQVYMAKADLTAANPSWQIHSFSITKITFPPPPKGSS